MLKVDPLDALECPEERLGRVGLNHIVGRRDEEDRDANQVHAIDNGPRLGLLPSKW